MRLDAVASAYRLECTPPESQCSRDVDTSSWIESFVSVTGFFADAFFRKAVCRVYIFYSQLSRLVLLPIDSDATRHVFVLEFSVRIAASFSMLFSLRQMLFWQEINSSRLRQHLLFLRVSIAAK